MATNFPAPAVVVIERPNPTNATAIPRAAMQTTARTLRSRRFTSVTAVTIATIRGVAVHDFVHARVRSRGGPIGGLNVSHEMGRPIGETGRMVLRARAQ